MSELVFLSREGNFALIHINNPPVNALSPGVSDGLLAALRNSIADPSVDAIILLGTGKTFIAGADIREFQRMTSGEKEAKVGLYPLMLAVEDSPKPVVCAIHGNALGGGLEVAMACHYRVAVPTARVGQPEVKLGLIPGAGGTQRLPRLAGVARALRLIVRGDLISASDAAGSGIIDHVVPGDLLEGTLTWTRDLLAKGLTPRKTRELSAWPGEVAADKQLFDAARDDAGRWAPGQVAPLKAIEAIEAATRLSFEEGCRKEEALFMECLFSDQSRALIRVFFAERDFARIPEEVKALCDAASKRLRERGLREAISLAEDGVEVGEMVQVLREFGMQADWTVPPPSTSNGAGSRKRLPIGRPEIIERMVYALINEGAHIVGEGRLRPAHIDILCIRDCGFPAYRGGPMWYADSVGLETVSQRLRSLQERLGARWVPAPILESLAASGLSLAEYVAG
jgi:enoyl-CoA hydratase/carnithine racemase